MAARFAAKEAFYKALSAILVKLKKTEKTFTFSVTAPQSPGVFNFQWRMVEELKQWFGEKSENVPIAVVEAGNKNLP